MGSTAPQGLFRSLFKGVYLSFNLKKATSGGFLEMNEAPARDYGLEGAQSAPRYGALVRPPILSRIMDAFHLAAFLRRLINGINLDRIALKGSLFLSHSLSLSLSIEIISMR